MLKGVIDFSDVPGVLGRAYTSTRPYERVTCPGAKNFFMTMEVEGNKVISRPKYYSGGIMVAPGHGKPNASLISAGNTSKFVRSLELQKQKYGRLTDEEQRQVRALREALENSQKIDPALDKRLKALEITSDSGTRF
jgi:hypothetical protein